MKRLNTFIKRRGVIILNVALLLLVVYTLCHMIAPRMADTVTITVQSYTNKGPRTAGDVYDKTLRDAATVGRVESLLASVRRYAPWTQFNCPVPPRTILAYAFHFSWQGIPVQDVLIPNDTCVSMTVTTLGIRDPFISGGPTASQWQEMAAMTGVPIGG